MQDLTPFDIVCCPEFISNIGIFPFGRADLPTSASDLQFKQKEKEF